MREWRGKLCSMVVVMLLVCPLVLGGCSGAEVPPPPARPIRAAPPPPPPDLSDHGVPVRLGAEIDVKGYNTVWVKGTRLLITLMSTQWDEISGTREGRAKFSVKNGGETIEATVWQGRPKRIFGFTFTVSHAYELHTDEGRFVPHAIFKVVR